MGPCSLIYSCLRSLLKDGCAAYARAATREHIHHFLAFPRSCSLQARLEHKAPLLPRGLALNFKLTKPGFVLLPQPIYSVGRIRNEPAGASTTTPPVLGALWTGRWAVLFRWWIQSWKGGVGTAAWKLPCMKQTQRSLGLTAPSPCRGGSSQGQPYEPRGQRRPGISWWIWERHPNSLKLSDT